MAIIIVRKFVRDSRRNMPTIFVLLPVFISVLICNAHKDPSAVPAVTDSYYSVPNQKESDYFKVSGTIATGTPPAITTDMTESTADVVTAVLPFLLPFGRSSMARFIPALTRDCRELLEDYANVSSIFVHCALFNAKPLLLCETCVVEFNEVEKNFREIEKADTCSDSLLSSDRVQILREIHKFLKNLWQKANCESCFKDVKDCTNKTTENCPLAEKVSKFRKYNNETLNCFEAVVAQNGDVCTNCSAIYQRLSKAYQSLGEVEEICFDCVELMNSTRKEWSVAYNCTCTRKDVVSIVAISIFFCSFPIFFYLGSKMHSVKVEHKLMKQNRLRKTHRPSQPKLITLPEHGEAFLTEESSSNTI
ncbi:osteopetrosis-associated transmembrane protein 1-like [Acanthaster planci]|uniref:Osteopetrosis-associated transmembrane protein 1-like n=1 Tax=Acanthaster planci TaxID=133434 RepID=A0A8B7YEA3_ACAPL|nr:osteopetrosis-associated transmembrane protein 1-like [Acanthaster planci]